MKKKRLRNKEKIYHIAYFDLMEFKAESAAGGCLVSIPQEEFMHVVAYLPGNPYSSNVNSRQSPGGRAWAAGLRPVHYRAFLSLVHIVSLVEQASFISNT